MATLRAGEQRGEYEVVFAAKLLALFVGPAHHRKAIGKLNRRLEAFGEALFYAGFDLEAIDNDIDGVFLVLFEFGWIVEFADNAVDTRADKTARAQFAKDMQMLTLTFAHNRCEHHDAAAFGQLHNLIDHLTNCLSLELQIMLGAVGLADTREQ